MTPPSIAPTRHRAAIKLLSMADFKPKTPPFELELVLEPAVADGRTVAPALFVPVVVAAAAAPRVTTPFLTVEYEEQELLGGMGCAGGVAPCPCWNVELP